MEVPKVYAAISSVMAVMAKEGISKDRKNQQQGYNFRGIDDIYAALGGVLSSEGLMMLPRVVGSVREERQTQKGGLLIYTSLTVEFDLVSAADGSKHTICTVGEAMDSGDKSSNKAMSAALKYAALQVFMIPTEGENDADATTHEVAPRQSKQSPPKQKETPKDERQPSEREVSLWNEMNALTSLRGLKLFWEDNASDLKYMGEYVFNRFAAKKDELKNRLPPEAKQEDDRFPGDEPIRNGEGRELMNGEAG